MQLISFENREDFQREAEAFLTLDEGPNHLIYDLVRRVHEFATPDDPPLMVMLRDQTGAQGVALRTDSSHSLILSKMSSAAIKAVLGFAQGITGLVGVVGERDGILKLETLWPGLKTKEERELGFYQLESVKFPTPCSGRMRLATPADEARLWEWYQGFEEETRAGLMSRERIQAAIREKRQFFWELDTTPRAMAVVTGTTPLGAKISGVYTEKAYRGRGLASQLVAHMSQKLIEAGHPKCFLFTDMANPTSNSIYQKVGYEFVCYYRDWKFAH